ncbi:hypothetical protein N7510_004898 [Penicillium lagena]|uniref:uncharacterized protein n=1 Tax=Penicillium lagena TaxID=94218 RepID=UPI0025411D7C|nr:uncharacterized protein N7510_004898 [Penicillium lagena]KAJ5620914.1 hypothetical protein N7510_004898 [Penicillium lagena]
METQDSLDISQLQRVALGLEQDPSQPRLAALALPENSPQTTPRRSLPDARHCSDGDALSTTPGRPSNFLPDHLHPSLSGLHQHEASLMVPPNVGAQHEAGTESQVKMSYGETAPGDTQVVSQSVFDSIIQNNTSSIHPHFSQTGAGGETMMTLHQEESGHIDLLSQFESAPNATHLSRDHDDHSSSAPSQSSPLAYQPDLFPESQRFLTTPGTTTKIPTKGAPTETPSMPRNNPLAGDIESSGGLLGLSQLFKATPAPSSPLVHGQQPELASDRPSPNIPIHQPRLAPGISSPLRGLPVDFMIDSSEPNLNYISMKESQTNRERVHSERMTRSADDMPSEDHSDPEFFKESSFVERARRQRRIEEEAAAQFAGLTAPSRTSPTMPPPHSDLTHSGSPEHSVQEPQDVDMMLHTGASEEETEHEDVDQQVPRSQEFPYSSTEEDKENYNGPPVAVAAASSAHDRLSQILHGTQDPFDAHEDGQFEMANPPSQIMVMDSQPSPLASPDRIGHEGDEERPDANPRPGHEVRIGPSSDVHKVSPVRHSVQSSPPYSQREGGPPCGHTPSRPHGAAASTGHSPNMPVSAPQDPSSYESRQLYSSNPKNNGSKQSSMPSRVIETPVHLHLKSSADMARLTSIPETSPSHSQNHAWEEGSNGDGVNIEDDDLPPMFPVSEHIRRIQPRPSGTRTQSSPLKKTPLKSIILSSPSGRQRRRLTEIASDASPQVGPGFFDMGIGIFTNEDQEFRDLIESSPTQPRKKRRGNDGQAYHESEPVIPVTPRVVPPKTVTPLRQQSTPQEPETEETIHVPETTSSLHNNSFADGLEANPPPAPRPLQEKQAPTQKPAASTPVRPVLPPDPKFSVLSELTELDSDEMAEMERSVMSRGPRTPRGRRLFSDATPVAPRQILAPWSGLQRAYYPAVCLGTPLGVSQDKYLVKFEDSDLVEVPKGAVKRFDLREGDAVKVDLPNIPKVTHIIRGFDHKLTKEEILEAPGDFPPLTDIHGHSTVILGPKQRKSLPGGGLNSTENVIKVPISRIYFDMILWNNLKDRAFTYQPEIVPQQSKPTTPPEKRTSVGPSPSSRLSRGSHYASGIFAGMAFAVSYKEDESTKNHVTKLIMDNGGILLHEGFTELFETSSITAPATPTKASARDAETRSGGLRLTASAQEVGFACLIADTHSRREKYMQALALNLPCLSGRWVEDCVAKGRVLDWDVYLLPAGESMYLNGVTKSRVLTPTPPDTACLSETIASRPRLLDGHSVILVMGRGKAEEKRRAYIFLTFALGASRIERVPDLDTARAMLESQSEAGMPSTWDWIYVDDADQAAAKTMLAAPKSRTRNLRIVHGSGGRKRRKSEVLAVAADGDALCNAKVVGNDTRDSKAKTEAPTPLFGLLARLFLALQALHLGRPLRTSLSLPPRQPPVVAVIRHGLNPRLLRRATNLPIRLPVHVTGTQLRTLGRIHSLHARDARPNRLIDGSHQIRLAGDTVQSSWHSNHIQPAAGRLVAWVRQLLVLLKHNPNILAIRMQLRIAVIPHITRVLGEDGMVSADAAVLAGEPFRAALSEDDASRHDVLAARALGAEALACWIARVFVGGSLRCMRGMSHLGERRKCCGPGEGRWRLGEDGWAGQRAEEWLAG